MNKKSKKDDDEIINFYEKMPSKYKPVYHNPSYDRLKINYSELVKPKLEDLQEEITKIL